MTKDRKGTLYLLPVLLHEGTFDKVLPPYNLKIIESLDLFIVENIRTARRFLKKAGYNKSVDDEHFLILDKRTTDIELAKLLQPIMNGRNAGLMSESGVPCIADPGSRLVRLAQETGIQAIPLTGPSSIILGLMASGLNGQDFVFHGYLPVKEGLKKTLHDLEQNARRGQTQIFIEAPYRNQRLLSEILSICHEEILLCIASQITSPEEFIRTKKIRDWKKQVPDIQKKNTIFLLGS